MGEPDYASVLDLVTEAAEKLEHGFDYSGRHFKLRTSDPLRPVYSGLMVEGEPPLTCGDVLLIRETLRDLVEQRSSNG